MHLPTVSILCLILLLPDEASFQFTNPQIAIILAVGALGTTAGIIAGSIFPGLRRPTTTTQGPYDSYGYGYGRRRRAAVEHNISFGSLGISEPEECFRRVFCAAATGKVTNPEIANVLVLLSLEDVDKEFVKAAKYGKKRSSKAACEARYHCSASMNLLEKMLTPEQPPQQQHVY